MSSPLTDAAIAADVALIFADLAATGATETVSRIPEGEDTASGTFDVVRAKQLKTEELMHTGFAQQYRLTVYAPTSAIGDTREGDILVMADGTRLRVYRVNPQPAQVVTALDLGGEFEDGDRF